MPGEEKEKKMAFKKMFLTHLHLYKSICPNMLFLFEKKSNTVAICLIERLNAPYPDFEIRKFHFSFHTLLFNDSVSV